jgi:predicted flavoprotein YhiN
MALPEEKNPYASHESATPPVIVIGGGASGLLAAGRAAELGAAVLLLEKRPQPGSKLLLAGHSRCNLSHSGQPEEFISHYGENGRFLQGAFHRFFRPELLDLLQRYGIQTYAEPDGRIFPVGDSARDVLAALQRYLVDGHVALRLDCRVTGLLIAEGRVTGVQAGEEILPASAVIIACGGASYPGTGSSGDGYRLATAAGHTILPLRPALVPLRVRESDLAGSLQGASLRHVRLTSLRCPAGSVDPALIPAHDCGRALPGKRPQAPIIESRTGDVMITHFGLSGPAALLMSRAIVMALEEGPVSISIDLCPDVSLKELRSQLQAAIEKFPGRRLPHLLQEFVTPRVAAALLSLCQLAPDMPAKELVKAERDNLAGRLKSWRFNITESLPLAAATVTSGGVSLKEIDPRTMESRLVKGLYICGEILDIDGDSGGYNLQAAFSTGFIAGEAAAQRPAIII